MKISPFFIDIKQLEHYQKEKSLEFQKLKEDKPDSIIDYIEQASFKSQEAVLIFLFNLSKDIKISTKFIDEVIARPKDTYHILNILLEILNGNNARELLELWLNDEMVGYKYAYKRYFEKLWSKSLDLENLIKLSPNIAPWALRGKAHDLGKESITLGAVPDDFGGTIENYRKLIFALTESKFYKDFVAAKDFEANPDDCKKFARSIGLKQSDTIHILKAINKRLQEDSKPFKIKNYIVTPIIKSVSSKLIFFISVNDNKYILKMDPYFSTGKDKTDKTKKRLENSYLRGDMPYTNSLVDFYLKLNGCTNAADILFYDQETDSALYKATEAKSKGLKIPKRVLENLFLVRNNEYFYELQQMGILINDPDPGNFIITDHKRIVLIDGGHLSYFHPLRPMLRGYHFALGNLCGREYVRLP